jgi:hypothetical protein
LAVQLAGLLLACGGEPVRFAQADPLSDQDGGEDDDPGVPLADAPVYTGEGSSLAALVFFRGDGPASAGEGAIVSELGNDEEGFVGADGLVTLELERPEAPELRVTAGDYVPTLWAASRDGLLAADAFVVVDVLYLASELKDWSVDELDDLADFEDVGSINAVFWHDGGPEVSSLVAGAQFEIDAPSFSSWVLEEDDTLVPGDQLLPDGSVAEFWLRGVEPGRYALSWTVPEGTSCQGPAEATVEAGAYTWVQIGCWADEPER